jgi:hypothetical protein
MNLHSKKISKLNFDDIPARLTNVQKSGSYNFKKYIGIFVPSERLSEIRHFLSESFIKTKNIVFTKSTGDWRYTMIYYSIDDSNASILLNIKEFLSLPLKIETADTENDLSDFVANNLLA